jgi:hypothetical protein
MTKELVTIEFRYFDKPSAEDDIRYRTRVITIGIFETFEEAIIEGNKALEIFEKYFKLTPGCKTKDRFGKNNSCFNFPTRLVSPLGYLECPFDFYAKIEKLSYDNVEETILDVLAAQRRYQCKNICRNSPLN